MILLLLNRSWWLFHCSYLIKMCTFLPEIHNMTQQSTTVLSNCTRCNKALSRSQGSWWCERCQKSPNLCCLCQKLVKGLFAWCQGCSHGGHLKCLKSWYRKNTLCPTGCGHHCEFQWKRNDLFKAKMIGKYNINGWTKVFLKCSRFHDFSKWYV